MDKSETGAVLYSQIGGRTMRQMDSELADILIVEDDEMIARLMQMHLRAAGWRTHHVDNGNDALEVLQHGSWKLVVLDRMLPGKSGMQVLRWIHRPDQEEHVPVLIVTALGSTGRNPMSSRWKATSSSPTGGVVPSIFSSAWASSAAARNRASTR